MLPHEKELVERLKDKPFALIGVNSDDPDSKGDPAARTERNASFRKTRKAVGQQLVAGPEEAAFIERARASVRTILDEQGISWRNAIEGSTSGPWPTKWNVQSWPTIYLIDHEGVIRHVNPPRDPEKLDAILEEMVAAAEAASKDKKK